MFCKIALNNIKKSFKDYTIYFMTLIIAISMFYIFNSLDAQQSMISLTASKNEMVGNIVELISIISVFVAGVLGYLVLYANNFLIRRRKKEFGLYQTLGMSKKRISLIIFIESLTVGIISLLIGTTLGVILSQGLSVVTAKMFDANLKEYHFIFSKAACMKTLIYFSLIYLFVYVFNIFTISRYKLIDLLSASKKNQKVRVKNSLVKAILFIASLGLIGYAYKMLLVDHVAQYMENSFFIMLAIGAMGTYLLFVSIASFALKVVQSNKKIYYKNLNTFVLRQLNNKINTTTLSITVISLMLLLTITILSCSLALVNAFNTDIDNNNKTDLTMIDYVDEQDNEDTITTKVEQYDLDKYFSNKVEYNSYLIKTTEKYFFNDEIISEMKAEFGQMMDLSSGLGLHVMKLSEYNKLMDLYGMPEEKLTIDEDKYILSADFEKLLPYLEKAMVNGKIQVGDKLYTAQDNKCRKIVLMNNIMPVNTGTLILNDDVIENNLSDFEFVDRYLCANYVEGNKEKTEQDFLAAVKNIRDTRDESVAQIFTKLEMQASHVGTTAMITYLGMFLGLVFAITSASILAIGQLSESSDNKERYSILRRIGVDDKMINHSLFIQILIYFGLPLVVAIIHSAVALKEANSLISTFGQLNVGTNLLIAGGFVLFIYGIYFVATYLSSKAIIKEKEKYTD